MFGVIVFVGAFATVLELSANILLIRVLFLFGSIIHVRRLAPSPTYVPLNPRHATPYAAARMPRGFV